MHYIRQFFLLTSSKKLRSLFSRLCRPELFPIGTGVVELVVVAVN